MHKVTITELTNPHARARRECEETVASEKAAYQAESESITKESEKLEKDRTRLFNKWHRKEISEQAFIEQGKALQARYEAFEGKTVLLQKRQDAVRDALDRQIASFDAEIGDQVQKQRALTSLLIGTGRSTSAIQLLHDSLGDYAKITDRAEKHRLMATVRQIYASAVELNPTSEMPSILTDLDRLPEGEARTEFYRRHRAELMAAHDTQTLKDIENETSNS